MHNYTQVTLSQTLILTLTIYKPDSKKVGTLYKLWIKKECNNLQIIIFYSQ